VGYVFEESVNWKVKETPTHCLRGRFVCGDDLSRLLTYDVAGGEVVLEAFLDLLSLVAAGEAAGLDDVKGATIAVFGGDVGILESICNESSVGALGVGEVGECADTDVVIFDGCCWG